MHRRGGVGDRASGSGTFDFGLGRVQRPRQGALRSGGDDRPGRRVTQDRACAGTPLERSTHRPTAASHAATTVAGGDRLAFVALLWTTNAQPQRNCTQQTETGDGEFSRLRLGLHRATWAALHAGVDLGAPPRDDGRRVAPLDRQNQGNRAENQVYSRGSGFFQRGGDRLFSAGRSALFDARDVPRPPRRQGHKTDRIAMDQATTGWLVFPFHEQWRQTEARYFGVRELSPLSGSQDEKTKKSETAFCGMACAWQSDGNPRTLPEAVRHRNQFSPDASGPHIHLHSQPSIAAVFHRNCLDITQRMGLDSSDPSCGRSRKENNPASGMSPIQAHARLDSTRNRRPIARRLNTLRRFTAVRPNLEVLKFIPQLRNGVSNVDVTIHCIGSFGPRAGKMPGTNGT